MSTYNNPRYSVFKYLRMSEMEILGITFESNLSDAIFALEDLSAEEAGGSVVLRRIAVALLRGKYEEEFETFKNQILSLPKEEIFGKSCEIQYRKDILDSLTDCDLSFEQALKLLKSNYGLDAAVNAVKNVEYANTDFYSDIISGIISKEEENDG